MRAIAEEASALVRKYKGAYSGEHGDGLCRGEWIEWQFGPTSTEAFRAIKQRARSDRTVQSGQDHRSAEDGRWVAVSLPTALGAASLSHAALEPVLDWSAWNVQNDPLTEQISPPGTGSDNTGGFAKAVEMCNNNGHCRKFDAGTMCPSYRVTRDEQHADARTRQHAAAGALRPARATTPHRRAMYATLDLCVSCKGCRRECPTGVDMARMKIEFLAHYKARHGHTAAGSPGRPAARLRGDVRAASRGWSICATGARAWRWLSEKLLGFSAAALAAALAHGHLLALADASLLQAATSPRAAAAGGKAAVLFVDTFNGTFESENALAAARRAACGGLCSCIRSTSAARPIAAAGPI